MNDDAECERRFWFRPFAVDVFGDCGAGATAIPKQLARTRSEHASTTVAACKRLAFPSRSVAAARCRPRTRGCCDRGKLLSPPLSTLPQPPGSGASVGMGREKRYKSLFLQSKQTFAKAISSYQDSHRHAAPSIRPKSVVSWSTDVSYKSSVPDSHGVRSR
jgi:hypothetical protein